MALPAWYNDNQFRDYPFITRTEPVTDTEGFSSSSSSDGVLTHLPSSAILDFGAIMELDANYIDDAGHYVYLHFISRSGSTFTFSFRTNAPAGANYQLLFTRELTDAEFKIEWEDASSIAPEPAGTGTCSLQPRWQGFLATGDLSDLADLVGSGEKIIFNQGLWKIEPARIQSLANSYLQSISLANTQRIVATLPEGCSASSSSSESSNSLVDDAILNASCLTGQIKFKEGYNCSIRQDNNDNAIIISAGVGSGAGEPCEEVPRYPGEALADNSKFYSGGPACDEVVKSINGVTGASITIIAGSGIDIDIDETQEHTLVINRSLTNFAVCFDTVSLSSSSALG